MMGDESVLFLDQYQEASANMGNDVVEYIRGISVVKIFGQTAFSFKSFNKAIENYRDFTISYALSMKNAMSGYIVCVYGIFAFLIPATIILLIILVTPKNTFKLYFLCYFYSTCCIYVDAYYGKFI